MTARHPSTILSERSNLMERLILWRWWEPRWIQQLWDSSKSGDDDGNESDIRDDDGTSQEPRIKYGPFVSPPSSSNDPYAEIWTRHIRKPKPENFDTGWYVTAKDEATKREAEAKAKAEFQSHVSCAFKTIMRTWSESASDTKPQNYDEARPQHSRGIRFLDEKRVPWNSSNCHPVRISSLAGLLKPSTMWMETSSDSKHDSSQADLCVKTYAPVAKLTVYHITFELLYSNNGTSIEPTSLWHICLANWMKRSRWYNVKDSWEQEWRISFVDSYGFFTAWDKQHFHGMRIMRSPDGGISID